MVPISCFMFHVSCFMFHVAVVVSFLFRIVLNVVDDIVFLFYNVVDDSTLPLFIVIDTVGAGTLPATCCDLGVVG